MEKIMSYFASYINVFRINDLFDILIVALALYWIIKFLKQTRAAQLTKGIVVLLLATYISGAFHLNVVNYLLSNAVQMGVLALVIIFQPEFRNALEHVGRTRLGDWMSFSNNYSDEGSEFWDEICNGVDVLAKRRIGALIVISRKTGLGEIVSTGKMIDAKVQADLLVNIFYPNTPLHDGAVVVNNGRVEAAGCLLPLTKNDNLSTELGTRHRAAIGMSEVSDAVILVVSEETGKISVAKEGALTRNFTKESLKRFLEKTFNNTESSKHSAFARFKTRGR